MSESRRSTSRSSNARSSGRNDVGNQLKLVIGMSLAYVTSFAGLVLAYYSYKKHHRDKEAGK
jgi:hypothetical protein